MLQLCELVSSLQILPKKDQELAISLLSSTLASQFGAVTGHFKSGSTSPTTQTHTSSSSCYPRVSNKTRSLSSKTSTTQSYNIASSNQVLQSVIEPYNFVVNSLVSNSSVIGNNLNVTVPNEDNVIVQVVQDDIQYSRIGNYKPDSLLLSQPQKVFPRSQKDSSCEKALVSHKEAKTQSQKERALWKTIHHFPQAVVGSERSQQCIFQQGQVSSKQIHHFHGKNEQIVSNGGQVEQLQPVSLSESGKTFIQKRLSPRENIAALQQDKSFTGEDSSVKSTEESSSNGQNIKEISINYRSYQQTPLSLVSKFITREKIHQTFRESEEMSRKDDKSCTETVHVQQQGEVSFGADQRHQPGLFKMSQTNDPGYANCGRLSSQDERVLQEENISCNESTLPRGEKYQSLGTRRLPQVSDESTASESSSMILRENSCNDLHPSILPVNKQSKTSLKDESAVGSFNQHDSEEICLIVDDCSVNSVDVESLVKPPSWEQDKMSMTKDLREATLNLEKSLSRLKKQQELHFQQQSGYSDNLPDQCGDCDPLCRKLFLESNENDLHLDFVKYRQFYSQRATQILDQSLMVLDSGFSQATKDDGTLGESTDTTVLDLPPDLTEVLDYSIPPRPDKLCELPTDLSVGQVFQDKSVDAFEKEPIIISSIQPKPSTDYTIANDVPQPTDLSVAANFRDADVSVQSITAAPDFGIIATRTDATHKGIVLCASTFNYYSLNLSEINDETSPLHKPQSVICSSFCTDSTPKIKINHRKSVKRKHSGNNQTDFHQDLHFSHEPETFDPYVDLSGNDVVYDLSLPSLDHSIQRTTDEMSNSIITTRSSIISELSNLPQDLSLVNCTNERVVNPQKQIIIYAGSQNAPDMSDFMKHSRMSPNINSPTSIPSETCEFALKGEKFDLIELATSRTDTLVEHGSLLTVNDDAISTATAADGQCSLPTVALEETSTPHTVIKQGLDSKMNCTDPSLKPTLKQRTINDQDFSDILRSNEVDDELYSTLPKGVDDVPVTIQAEYNGSSSNQLSNPIKSNKRCCRKNDGRGHCITCQPQCVNKVC